MKEIFRKYLLCVFFSFVLFVVVWLSEILRDIVLAVSAGWSSGIVILMLYSVFIFFLFVFGIVPLCLLSLFLFAPKLMRRFFATLGVTEDLLEKKKTKKESQQKETVNEEKRDRGTEMQGWVFSKWFYYGLIAVLLAVLFCVDWYASYQFNNDFAVRFMPTLIGIVFNFVFLIVFFDLREKLEWKEVEDRTKKLIGSEIFSLFTLVGYFCEVDRSLQGNFHDRETWKELERKQLKQMIDEVVINEIMAKDLMEKNDLAMNYASMVESSRLRISEIENKYGRFLNPKLRASLMDIQNYLGTLRFELKLGNVGSAERPQFLKDTIGKIVKEINNARENGIDIGF